MMLAEWPRAVYLETVWAERPEAVSLETLLAERPRAVSLKFLWAERLEAVKYVYAGGVGQPIAAEVSCVAKKSTTNGAES